MSWSYTKVKHTARMRLNLTPNEYCVYDIIFHSQSNPEYSQDGWAKNPYSQISKFLGFSKSTIHGMIERGVRDGLVEVNAANSQLKRMTEKWSEIVYSEDDKANDRSETERYGREQDKAAVRKPNEYRSEIEREGSDTERDRSATERHIKGKKKKKEKEERKEPAADFFSFKVDECLAVLKNKIDDLEIEYTAHDPETLLNEIARQFVIKEKTLDPKKDKSVRGLVGWAKGYINNLPKETPGESGPMAMVDQVEEVCSLFTRHLTRRPSERAKKAVSYKIHELMKQGESLEDFEHVFRFASENGAPKWKDFETSIDGYKRLKSYLVKYDEYETA